MRPPRAPFVGHASACHILLSPPTNDVKFLLRHVCCSGQRDLPCNTATNISPPSPSSNSSWSSPSSPSLSRFSYPSSVPSKNKQSSQVRQQPSPALGSA